ncbi:hypothetical protein Purlil1_14152 [Purpureocillium lilacinum]|uniref:Uncharacterized protein n=1 Tax=Purpureocillium lilacinum TaxID=33203 RepID=A0ABR0BC29_PURLI|nr:hypothetical protein Purlil1_14152 [Purpureocillium lilacinum]
MACTTPERELPYPAQTLFIRVDEQLTGGGGHKPDLSFTTSATTARNVKARWGVRSSSVAYRYSSARLDNVREDDVGVHHSLRTVRALRITNDPRSHAKLNSLLQHPTTSLLEEHAALSLTEFDRRRIAAEAVRPLGKLRNQTFDFFFPGTMSMRLVDATPAELEEMKVKRRRSMYYRLRLGKRLLELVRRFGYCTLVYSGFGCGETSINHVNNLVAVIVQWGAPPDQLATEMIPYKSLEQH